MKTCCQPPWPGPPRNLAEETRRAIETKEFADSLLRAGLLSQAGYNGLIQSLREQLR